METFFTAPASLHNRHYEKFADGRVKDIEDEIPFTVPEGWAWCRLKDIVTYIDDGDWIESKEQSDLGIRLLQTGNIGCGHFKDKEGNYHYISEETFKKLNCNEIYPGDILISRLPEPVGRACIVPNLSQRLITAVDCAIIRLKQDIISKNYFIYYTQSAKYLELIKNNCMGTTRLRISRANLEKTLIPLPPLVEQKRIVTAVGAIFTQIALLEQNQADLQAAIKQAKSKILDLAIHGKLVSQDLADEPASVMLEKLRAEKEAKIAAGEIKRSKNDSYIYRSAADNCYYQKYADGCEENISDEIPFDVPDGWAWCRLGEVGQYKKGPFGSTLTKSIFVLKSDNTIKVYEQKNVIQKRHTLGEYYITREYFESNMKGFEVFPGDILVSCAGTIGETYILPDDIEQGIINQALMKMSITRHIDKFYFLKYFDHRLKEIAVASGKGIAIKNIPPFDVFKNFLFPLPPLAEQKRIVTKIEELFAQLDFITTALAD